MPWKKLFVVEGPDGAGKTTLIKQLEEALSWHTEVVHHGPYLDRSDVQLRNIYHNSFVRTMGERKHNVILDRSWVSEVMYGTVVRDGSRISNADIKRFELHMRNVGGAYIMCMPPVETCLANYAARKEMEYLENEESLRTIYGLYDTFKTDQKMFYHDYTKSSVQDLISVMKSVKTISNDDLNQEYQE